MRKRKNERTKHENTKKKEEEKTWQTGEERIGTDQFKAWKSHKGMKTREREREKNVNKELSMWNIVVDCGLKQKCTCNRAQLKTGERFSILCFQQNNNSKKHNGFTWSPITIINNNIVQWRAPNYIYYPTIPFKTSLNAFSWSRFSRVQPWYLIKLSSWICWEMFKYISKKKQLKLNCENWKCLNEKLFGFWTAILLVRVCVCAAPATISTMNGRRRRRKQHRITKRIIITVDCVMTIEIWANN